MQLQTKTAEPFGTAVFAILKRIDIFTSVFIISNSALIVNAVLQQLKRKSQYLVAFEMRLYIYQLLKTDYFLKYAIENATGSTIKNVSLKTMKDLLVPLPPIAEQKRIVNKIEELIPIIDGINK